MDTKDNGDSTVVVALKVEKRPTGCVMGTVSNLKKVLEATTEEYESLFTVLSGFKLMMVTMASVWLCVFSIKIVQDI